MRATVLLCHCERSECNLRRSPRPHRDCFVGFCHGNSNEHTLSAKAGQASCSCDSALPMHSSLGSEATQCGSGDQVALKVEGVVNGGVHAEKALGGSSRLEALQLALASSHCLMRVFRPIVIPQPLLMQTGKLETLGNPPSRAKLHTHLRSQHLTPAWIGTGVASCSSVYGIARSGSAETGCSVAEEPMVCMTLRWRELDSNFPFLD